MMGGGGSRFCFLAVIWIILPNSGGKEGWIFVCLFVLIPKARNCDLIFELCKLNPKCSVTGKGTGVTSARK